ncbi:MAG: phage tail protein [Cyanobacteria bacterium P01_G01_bin.67]
MTSSNGNNSDRLDRIEAIVDSNSRAIQAIMEQRATDRLGHEERMRRLEDTVVRLDDTVTRLTRIEEAQNRMLASMDDDRRQCCKDSRED